jgi:hypothetical protein
VHLDIAFVEEDEVDLIPIGLEYPQREPVTPECFLGILMDPSAYGVLGEHEKSPRSAGLAVLSN